jgi:hypothetical protein
VTEIAIALTAATAAGPLAMEGRAFAERERPEDEFHRVSGWLDLPVAVGEAASTTGRLAVVGIATDDRVITIRYEGVLCGTALTLLAVAEDAQ